MACLVFWLLTLPSVKLGRFCAPFFRWYVISIFACTSIYERPYLLKKAGLQFLEPGFFLNANEQA